MNKVKEYRIKKGITQEELARQANITLGYVQKIEKGKAIPTVHIAISIAKALDTTVEKLFTNQELHHQAK